MSRKAMGIKELNEVMKACDEKLATRYVTFTIHPHAKIVTSIIVHLSDRSVEFNITNNPDENFVLYDAVMDFVNGLTY